MASTFTSLMHRLRSKGKRQEALDASVDYQCGGIAISLPADHMLPKYQAEHRLYDRFLPHLARYVSVNEVIVDVGANCGDTLAGMFANNPHSNYVCIEADDAFFAMLKENQQRITAMYPSAAITLVKNFVGLDVKTAVLAGAGGTKSAHVINARDTVAAASHRSVTLPDIIERHADLRSKAIRLLKSDVDGYDYDVIDSADSIIAAHLPMLFFECQYDNEQQKASYLRTLSRLAERGYNQFHLFDNFGNPLVYVMDVALIEQIIEYVWRQNRSKSTRTFYYLDIFACHSRDADLAKKAVRDFVTEIVEK